MPPKRRQQAWEELEGQMRVKRTRIDAMGQRGKAGAAPHELVVQRLAAEPDNKQTYRPVQPREFVPFEFGELTLTNLKKACAAHFNLPASTCDVLVSNKGPSCTNINQIPHRKDKVYLVRFAVHQESDLASISCHFSLNCSTYLAKSTESNKTTKAHPPAIAETKFPTSVSISEILQAGKLVKPKPKKKAALLLEKFDVKTGEWHEEGTLQLLVDAEKFSSGGFRDAFQATSCNLEEKQKWVIKKYNAKAKDAIKNTLKTTDEDHTCKQVQMHSAARQLTRQFSLKVPSQFGQCFHYNRVFYTKFEDEPATVEEFVPGNFLKYINNNGDCCSPPGECTTEYKDMFLKAECLVHYSYEYSKHKLMLLDIQGSKYQLYDPEIATTNLVCANSSEFFFCCGNLSTVAIGEFVKNHSCSKYCEMLELPPVPRDKFD